MDISNGGAEGEDLTRDWRWLLGTTSFTLLAISPFGDLFLQDDTGTLLLLDVNLGSVEYATEEGDDPARLFPIAFDDRLAGGYREAGLVLAEGQCYGYRIPGVAGGSFQGENVYVATLSEYVSFMGDFHEQIRDVADGETFKIKVINLPN